MSWGLWQAGSPVGVLRVEVVDTGAGIALEDQAKVFGQFAQFNRNELQKGGDLSFFGTPTTYTQHSIYVNNYNISVVLRRLGLRAMDFPQNCQSP